MYSEIFFRFQNLEHSRKFAFLGPIALRCSRLRGGALAHAATLTAAGSKQRERVSEAKLAVLFFVKNRVQKNSLIFIRQGKEHASGLTDTSNCRLQLSGLLASSKW